MRLVLKKSANFLDLHYAKRLASIQSVTSLSERPATARQPRRPVHQPSSGDTGRIGIAPPCLRCRGRSVASNPPWGGTGSADGCFEWRCSLAPATSNIFSNSAASSPGHRPCLRSRGTMTQALRGTEPVQAPHRHDIRCCARRSDRRLRHRLERGNRRSDVDEISPTTPARLPGAYSPPCPARGGRTLSGTRYRTVAVAGHARTGLGDG